MERVARLLRTVTTGEVDDVVALLEDPASGAGVASTEADTWETALHKVARAGKIEVARALLERRADANAECVKGRTCLHVACEAYAADETGDFCWEDMIELLVTSGSAVCIEDADGRLPFPGDDCCTRVERAVANALEDGADLRKEHAANKRERNRKKMDKLFEDKLVEHISTASAVTVAVRESPSRPDGWG